MEIKFSVLMSVYYKEKPEWLEFSLSSVLDQTLLPNEIVIVKDGPIDDELNLVIDEYSNKNPELFKVYSLNKNVGLGPALNYGMKQCQYDLIARMDSDDYIVPERFEKQLSIYKENSLCCYW